MSSRFILPFADVGSGIKPSSGAQLFFFATGGSTPKDTFRDQLSTPTPNANPVISNAVGVFPDIFITGSYKVVLKDKNGVQIWEADPIQSTGASGESIGTLTLAEAVANTSATEDQIVQITDRANGQFTYLTGQSPNTFDIVQCVGVPTLSLVLIVENGTVSTAELGTTKISSDFNALQHACNNGNWNTIIIESYSPIGGYAFLDRSNVIFDAKNRLIDYVGVSNPMLVLGEQSNGTPSTSSILNIDIRNVYAIGDKTAGSRIVFYRKASTCTHHNWRVSSLATPFNGDGEVGVGYESLACKFYDMDFRNNLIGWDDSVGSFQASTFYGGRIEANDFEGVRTKTTNMEFNGTIIEGNDVLLSGVSQVLASGGGSLQFSKCYMELKAASPNQAFITVASGATKRITIMGGDYYGQNTGPETALLVSGSNWTLGSLTVIGANLNEVNRICDRAGAVGNWHGSFDYWSNVALQDPALTLNGANFYDSNRVDGVTTDRFTALTRVTTAELKVQETGSAAFALMQQRFVGRIAASGVGVWHNVIDMDDLGATASTALSLDIKFLSRAADFYFRVNIVINGTSTVAFTDYGENNYSASLFRIDSGFLQVDNLPASNRDWGCVITTIKSALS